MDAPPALHEAVDRFTADHLGLDYGSRFGAAGHVRVPRVPAPSDPAARTRLAATRVVLIPGGMWPGVRYNGAAWLKPWGRSLKAAGVGDVRTVTFFDGLDPVSATFAPYVGHMGFVSRVVDAAAGAGGPVWLVGHSYGAMVATDAARRLPVDGVALLEVHLAHTGQFVPEAPPVPRLFVAENEAGRWPRATPGTRVDAVQLTGLSHVDMVLRPPLRLLAALVEAIAR